MYLISARGGGGNLRLDFRYGRGHHVAALGSAYFEKDAAEDVESSEAGAQVVHEVEERSRDERERVVGGTSSMLGN